MKNRAEKNVFTNASQFFLKQFWINSQKQYLIEILF